MKYPDIEFEDKMHVGSPGTSPPIPRRYPFRVHHVYGLTIPRWPDGSCEDAYSIAVDARTSYWRLVGGRWKRNWSSLGDAEAFLIFVSDATHQEYQWPDPYADAPMFFRPDILAQRPARELIRRHLSPRAYVFDIDMVIVDGRNAAGV